MMSELRQRIVPPESCSRDNEEVAAASSRSTGDR